MTLKEIRSELPTEGETCGMNIPACDSAENWMDHALEKMACQYIHNGDLFAAGMATAMQVMTVAMTLDGVDWQVIQDSLQSLEDYLN